LVETVDKMCSRIIVLSAGKIVFDGNLNGSSIEEITKKYMTSENMSEKIQGLYKNIS
jgi:ABC-type phosphate/phosphonate transport system ATPase subunit